MKPLCESQTAMAKAAISLLISLAVTACGAPVPDSDAVGTAIMQTQVASSGGPSQLPPSASTTQMPPTLPSASSTPEPVVPASADERWSKNYVGAAESGGVTLEIARLVVGFKRAIPDQPWEELNEFIDGWAETEVVAELIFRVTNNTDKTVSIFPDQGTVQIGSEQIELTSFMIFTGVGESTGGDIFAGVTKIGGLWFGVQRSTPAEITQIIYRTSAPFDSETFESLGPDIEIRIDVPDHTWEEVPEELR